MVSSLSKRGRPQAVYKASWGLQVPGLFKLSDGRWRVSGKAKVTFSEKDERLAVDRALALLSTDERGPMMAIPVAMADMKDDASVSRAFKALGIGPAQVPTPLANPFEPAPPRTTPAKKTPIRIEVQGDMMTFFDGLVQEPAFGSWLRNMILSKPQMLAEMTGIEQLGYLSTLKKPEPSGKLSTLIATYAAKAKLSPNELSRSKLFWAEFVRAVKVEHVDQIDHAAVVRYEASVIGSALAPKSQHHRFSKIKSVFSYAMKRGVDIAGCRHALDALKMLEVKDANVIDPKPVAPDDFWAIHRKATEAGDEVFATLMLVALGTCSYGGEVAAMRWSEVDLKAGTYVGRRPKTKISRVATLWPELVAALKKIPKQDTTDHIFHTSRRSYTTFSVLAAWRKYREAAGFGEDMTFGRIRDAAYSIACESGSLDAAKVLAGHRFSGASDFYIRRNPSFVAAACEAIRTEFKVKQNVR